jgi:hypothetical protein
LLKKHKRRNEVKERKSLKEKIKEEKEAKKIDRGQVTSGRRHQWVLWSTS